MIETSAQAADPAGDNPSTPLHSPERDADPMATENFRTPAFELDSVYGNGPGAHPFLYEKRSGGKLMVGESRSVSGASPTLTHDLHRDKQGIALIVDPNILKQVLKHGRKHDKPKNWPFIPVDFSIAAYRFGHSMVRETYSHNRIFPNATLSLEFLFTSGGGEVPVPSNWPIDWRRSPCPISSTSPAKTRAPRPPRGVRPCPGSSRNRYRLRPGPSLRPRKR